jgi:hypothetical protein
MPASSAPQTWRLVELLHASARPCPACGEAHRYLMRKTIIGDCVPVLFPPGIAVPSTVRFDVELHLAGPGEYTRQREEPSRYHEVAERVRTSSIRCEGEGCGERFEELEAYRVHGCAVRYRQGITCNASSRCCSPPSSWAPPVPC